MDESVIVHELAKEFTLKTFDFESKSSKDFFDLYMKTKEEFLSFLYPEDDPKEEYDLVKALDNANW